MSKMSRMCIGVFCLFCMIGPTLGAIDSAEKIGKDIEDSLRELDKKIQEKFKSNKGATVPTETAAKENPAVQNEAASKALSQGAGSWVWDGQKIYSEEATPGTKYISLIYGKSQQGLRLRVHVLMSKDGTMNLRANLLFDEKTDIKQEPFSYPKTASIKVQFDSFPPLDETITKMDKGNAMIFSFGRGAAYPVGGNEKRSLVTMLIKSEKLSIQFTSDFFAKDRETLRTAILNLDGLDEMLLQAVIALEADMGLDDDPVTLLSDYVKRMDRAVR